MPPRTLDRILQCQGFGTRRQCRAMVAGGNVKIGREVVSDPDLSYELENLHVHVHGTRWRCRARVYLALHKPPGYECSRKPSHHESIFALLPAHLITRGVQPAGRLDQDSSGLLLLSDDGAFLHSISSPKRHVAKTYSVTTRDAVTPGLVHRLREGVRLRGEAHTTAAMACHRVNARRLELKIAQGKYHQVKRMIAAAGTSCEALHRIAIGGLRLDSLDIEAGQWCDILPDQVDHAHVGP
ncbi:MAG: 16S rRNA pseudouridine(516) synthase [Nannocystaceae bacterium]